MTKIVFVSFGGPAENWHRRVNHICEQMKSQCPEIETIAYTEKDLQNDTIFWTMHGEFLNTHQRGYGYWIWKPYIVNITLEKLDKDDILIYADAGCTINAEGLVRLYEYIDIVKQNEFGLLVQQLTHAEIKFTKKDVLDYMHTNQDDMYSPMIMAGCLILRKTIHTMNIIKEWVDTTAKHDLIDDIHHTTSPYGEFIAHRHDQSIFSLLVKKYLHNDIKPVVIPDETYFLDFTREGKEFPIWATRIHA